MAQNESPKMTANTSLPYSRRNNRNVEVEHADQVGPTLKRLVTYFTKEKRSVTFLLLAVIVVVICSVTIPRLQSDAIDAITDARFTALPKILAAMAGVYAVSCLGTLFQGRLSAALSQKVVKRMREELFDQIVRLPIRYLDQHSHGDIMSRMTNDIENVGNTISQSVSSLVSGALTILGTAIMMFVMSPPLALLSWTTVILVILLTKFLSTQMRRFYRKKQALLGSLNSAIEENITEFSTVTAYNRQDAVLADFIETTDAYTKVSINAEIWGSSTGPVMNVINNTGFVIIAAAGGYLAIQGQISIGVISAFIIYAKQFGRPIEELANIYGQIQTAIAGAERVFSLLDEEREDQSGTLPFGGLAEKPAEGCTSEDIHSERKDPSGKDSDPSQKNSRGNISFSHVNFSYLPGKQVLFDFSFDVKAGHKIALVGATGSGKTTLVNLLMRFYHPDSGEITIDGVNIHDIDCCDLRRNMAIVLQDTVLFEDTVRNNLLYGREDATQDEIEAAVRMCECTQMIQNLPQGYETMLSQGGRNLSQGQRQLLTIARAFLADPKILILDEATSSVDTRTEKRIQDAMTHLMQNRTSLIIAHRLSTIQDADCIIVMDQGRIAETGSHEELLRRKGRYYELYTAQFAGKTI